MEEGSHKKKRTSFKATVEEIPDGMDDSMMGSLPGKWKMSFT